MHVHAHVPSVIVLTLNNFCIICKMSVERKKPESRLLNQHSHTSMRKGDTENPSPTHRPATALLHENVFISELLDGRSSAEFPLQEGLPLLELLVS